MGILRVFGGITTENIIVRSLICTLLVKLDNRCLCHLNHCFLGIVICSHEHSQLILKICMV